MNAMLHWFTSPEWAQIVKALLHSLWQGAVVALVLAVVMRRLANPVSRYRCSLAALVVVVVAGMLTWAVINSSERPRPAPISTQPIAQNQTAPDYIPPLILDSPDKIVVVVNRPPVATSLRWTAWLALVWLAGAAAMLTRAGVKVAGAEKLRRSCRPLNDERMEKLLSEARCAIGLAKKVRIGVTDKLTSPAVVGLFVPMLILPLSLMTTLTPEQIQFVLLHELAHIRRGDYLANLFQFFAESLLFFNPAVWWISHQVRREREACCDALAIELRGAPVDYARTLVHVAEKMMQPAPAAAMSLGNKREPSSLIDRVQRLLVPGYRPTLRLTWRAMLAALVLGGLLLVVSATGTRITVAAILPSNSSAASVSSLSNSVPQSSIGMTNTTTLVHGTNDSASIENPSAVESAVSPTNLFTRSFKVDPKIFVSIFPNNTEWRSGDMEALRKYLFDAGLPPLHSPNMMSYDQNTGILVVQSTSKDLDAVASVLQALNYSRPLSETNPATALLQDGKLLFEMGRLDQAEAKLKQAVTVEPDNLAARHYLDLIQETRNNISNKKINDPPYIASKSFDIGKEGNATLRKLASIRLDYVYYDNLPLDVVVHLLNEETKKFDPEKTGITFLIDTNLSLADVKAITVTIDPPRIKGRIGDVMTFIERGATKPLTAPLNSDGTIVFSLRKEAILYTRRFIIDTYTGFANLLKESALPETSSRKEQLQKLFSDAGVTPPLTNILVIDEGMLVVRGTKEQLDSVNKVVEKLNGTPSNYVGTLTQGQMDVVNKALEKLNGTTSNNSQTLPVPNPMARTNLVYTSKGRQAIATKLENIRLDSVHFDNESLSVVFSNLTQRVKELDPDKKGVSFILEANVASLAVTIQPAMTDVRLVDVLDAIIKNQHSIKYSVQDYGVVFSPMTGEEGRELYTRSFKVNPNTFLQNLENAKPNPGLTNISQIAGFFTEAGVDLQPPKSLFYNDRSGILFVRATAEDLDIIETVVQALTVSPPQINIKTRFVEMTGAQAASFMKEFSVTNYLNNRGVMVILTDPLMRTVLRRLEQTRDVAILNMPEVTTMSGRRAQVQMVDVVSIVTGINPAALIPPGIVTSNKNDSVPYTVNEIPLGPVLDITAHASADGYTIQLIATPSITSFLGYDKPTNSVATYAYVNGKKLTVVPPLPHLFSNYVTVTNVVIWDGQTLVTGWLISEQKVDVTDKVPVLGDLPGFLGRAFRSKSSTTVKKNLFVFITPTLIDPAGNRIHTDEDMPPTLQSFPGQTK